MSFESLLNLRVSVYRKTNQLFSDAISSEMTLTYQPPTNSVLMLTVSNLVGSGTLTVTGVVAGQAATEDFAFSQDGFLQGQKQFTSVTKITNTSITSGTLLVSSVTSSGQELYVEYLVKSGVKARIVERKSLVTVAVPGAVIKSALKMYCLADTDILENDVVVEDSTRYKVVSVIPKSDYGEVHHKTAGLQLEPLSA